MPAVPMRADATDKSEMVSQLLFGELVEIIEYDGNWRKIVSLQDQYQGWVDYKQIHIVNAADASRIGQWTHVVCDTIGTVRFGFAGNTFGPTLLKVPMGARIPDGLFRSTDGQFFIESMPIETPRSLIATACSLVGTPYLWGGKTLMGIDCSGFMQVVFRAQGITLPRDAWQQQMEGIAVESLNLCKEGDLVFFQNNEGRIIHVGMALDQGKIVHASGRVRIDRLIPEGIFNVEQQQISHNLHSIRRIEKIG